MHCDPVSVDNQPKTVALPEDSKLSLSEFVAKVLNQLSLSAWLPAAFFVISLAVLLTFREQQSLDLVAVLESLQDPRTQLTLLVTAIPGLVVATLVTQAFSFEAIRALEGYWRRGGPIALARTAMIRLQLWRKKRLRTRRRLLITRAFQDTRPEWLESRSSEFVNALERVALSEDLSGFPEDVLAETDEVDWWEKGDPAKLARIDHIEAALSEYPEEDARTLPMMLGNLIRATEDTLDHDGDVAGYALRKRASAPPEVQQQHDQFRVRLDMYCTLVFCALTLAVATPLLLLWQLDDPWLWGIAFGFLLLARAGYLAAMASARGYVSALRLFDAPS